MLKGFKDLLNEMNENIQLLIEYNSNKLQILNILIIKNEIRIETDFLHHVIQNILN